MDILGLLGSLFGIVNKVLPSKKEDAIMELQNLEGDLGVALSSNNDIKAALIRKRMKQIRLKFPDIEN